MMSLDDLPVLKGSHVKIKDSIGLLKKLNRLLDGGQNKLQIVTDFDHTLTKQWMEGKKILTSFGMLRDCPSIPQHYRDEDERLCSIYKPIEVDPYISRADKTKHMVEWYIAANDLLRNIKIPRNELMAVADRMKDTFRDGVGELIQWSERNQVPILVFSAGLGESVVAALCAANFLLPHVKVVSNFLATDENDVIVGMKGKVIHTLNKNEAAIKDTEYFELVKERGNVIVMGDSIGDAQMADGMDHCETLLKIGFLYHNAEGNLPNYMDHFDIVLIDDQTMDVVNAIIQQIL